MSGLPEQRAGPDPVGRADSGDQGEFGRMSEQFLRMVCTEEATLYHPAECQACFGHGDEAHNYTPAIDDSELPCPACFGTGREGIPRSEVFAEWRPGWDRTQG